MYDLALIGGGIVGVSTAVQLKRRYPLARIILIEKEAALSMHQTGRNSGVIHAGVYYAPGSLKAAFCRRGHALTEQFCQKHQVPYQRCGKLLVATNDIEVDRMVRLEKRCRDNEIKTIRLSKRELLKREPHITGNGAIFVPATGITDYSKITEIMAGQFRSMGGCIRTGAAVDAIREESRVVKVSVGDTIISTRYLVACSGLMADRTARLMGIDDNFAIVPFRGEYFRLSDRYRNLFTHLIYPIPDPELPFLGVHLTRMIGGEVTVGPNAVLGWKREGYGRVNFSLGDTLEMLRFPGFWKVMQSNLKTGAREFRDSQFLSGYVKRVQKYCPMVRAADLYPYPTGIRAQAILKDGTLVHDFLFAETDRSLHVINAPSPAATSAIPIGQHICETLGDKFSL